MEKTPQPDDQPQNEQEAKAKEAAKKIVFKIDDAAPGLENLPPEASELVKNIMSSDVFMKNPDSHSEKVMMESLTAEQKLAKAPQMDQQAQDLLRRMVMQEKLAENKEPVAKQETARPPEKPPGLKQEITSTGDHPIIKQDLSKPAEPPGTAPPPPPPPPPPPVFNHENNIPLGKDFLIDESGSIFGLQINKSKRKDVMDIMKAKGKESSPGSSPATLKYEDLGINFHFGDGGILQEITFSYPFEGSTSKGLQIYDPINKAIALYGSPKMRTPAGAIWDKIALFLNDDTITTIRLRNN